MIVGNEKDVPAVELQGEGLKNVAKKVLLSPREGWQGYVLRLFELGEEGYTPRHRHVWPHINFVLRGKGALYLEDREYELEAGAYAFVPGDAEHQFKNKGKETFALICIVPEEGEK